jgi:putative nucleotidyltransferase with HDIG domain
MLNNIKSYVQKIENLPTLPLTAQKIMNLNNDSSLSIEKLTNIVERDPAIAAKILSFANSAFFGFRYQTTDLDNAIMRIGFNNVKSIAVGISVLSFLDDSKKTSDYKRLFNHSIAVSLAARFIADHIKAGIEDILIEGLLHDLGYLILNRYFPDINQNILDSLNNEGSLLDAEQNILNSTHAEVGYWLAIQWNLPESILNTILYHHTPYLGKNAKQLALIHIADYVVAKNGYSPFEQDPHYPLDQSSLDILSISDTDLKRIEEFICDIPLSDEDFDMAGDDTGKVKDVI